MRRVRILCRWTYGMQVIGDRAEDTNATLGCARVMAVDMRRPRELQKQKRGDGKEPDFVASSSHS